MYSINIDWSNKDPKKESAHIPTLQGKITIKDR
jgi:hypothetical protein